MNSTDKFLVCLHSEPNFLSINILENLLANNCYVNVFTDNVSEWTEKTVNIAAKNRFNINNVRSFSNAVSYSYVILCSGFLDKSRAEKDIRNYFANQDLSLGKTFIVLPNEVSQKFKPNFIGGNCNVGVIYVGDLLGSRMDLQSDLKVAKYFSEIISNRSLTMPVGEVLYPLFVNDVSRQIVKWLFGFGPFGKEVCLLGQDTSTSSFWRANSNLVGEIKMQTISGNNLNRLPQCGETHRLPKDLNFMLSETYKWISLNNSKTAKIQRPERIRNEKRFIKQQSVAKNHKKIRYLLWLMIVILVLPIFCMITSGGLSYLAYSQIKNGNNKFAQKVLYLGKSSANVGYYESGVLKHIPVVGFVYKESEYINFLLVNASSVGIEGTPLLESGSELLGNALGDKPYSVMNVVSGVDINLQNIYRSLSVLEEKTVKSSNDGSMAAKYFSSIINFDYYKTLVSQTSEIAYELPDALGADASKTYLILFENNMELRPTGGFIGSYGLLTFDKGRLTDFAISDVYAADGQLNGHVEPPYPIKEYLGEANWWLRDSNWDPDFPTSAKRAEWFLDKEMDKKVDGVIAIDLNPISDFLEINGPVYLSDYNASITKNNFYERVQMEVEENFFPGTYKKASFLTALSKNILDEINTLSIQKGPNLLKIAYENLEKRHIQIFLHDAELQNSIKTLGWDGSVYVPKCGDNCYSDLVGVVEANVGVNKSNYFIKRFQKMNININGNRIDKTLTLTLSNSASPSLGLSGRYKSYIRLLVPEDSTEISVVSSIGQNTQSLIPEISNSKGRKEIGTILEVLPGETKSITFYWTAKLNRRIEQYGLFARKQAGVEEHPFSINVGTDRQILNSSPVFSLTEQGDYVYNTTLAKDAFAKLSF